MNKDELAFGIDIGGTNTKIGLFDRNGQLLAYHHFPSPKELAPAEFVEKISQECHKLHPLHDKRLIGIGVGAPMANYFTGMVDFAPNLSWRDVPLREHIHKYFNRPTFIENDANLAALGEKTWGAGKDLSDFVLITLGTGVGTGLITDKRLYRGNLGLGGEGGHVLIPHSKKRLCSCGGVNHLESFLSAKGIKQTIKELTGEEWTIERLGQLLRTHDLRAETIVSTIADELVSGLVSMAVLLGPEAFIIGGGVSKLGAEFNAVVEHKLKELVHFSLKGKVKIISASVSSDKGAIYGGAALVFEEIK
jgi:glucokinase